MEIATEMAASKPLRQSASVSKPIRKPVETSSDDDEDEGEEVDEVEDVDDASADKKNSVISRRFLQDGSAHLSRIGTVDI